MKKHLSITAILLLTLGWITSCVIDDNYELGKLLDPSEVQFQVVQDYETDAGGNTVILINDTPGTVSMWDYGTGKSNRQTDTIRFAFQGTYEINFSAMTGGGIVTLDPVTIEVTDDNLAYVSDPLWLALSGGPGEEKSWELDTEGKYFPGPLSFFGTDNGWLQGGNAWAGGDTGCYGEDCWNWDPEGFFAMDAGDYGTMTFSLKGGPYFHAEKPMEGGIAENGTYYLDINSKTLTINGASILRGYKPGSNGLTGISDWSNYTVLALNEDMIRLGVIRDRDVDGEGPVLLVYNFISKEYSENWVPDGPPPPDEGFDPDFAPGELLDMLTGGASTSRKWYLDGEGNPVDWLGSGIGWTSSSGDSYNWGWNDDWASIAESDWISFGQSGGVHTYTRFQDGEAFTGTFSIDEESNEIVLSGDLTLLQNPGHWMSPGTQTLKVVKAFPGDTEPGIWFGTSYNEEKDEWFAFHYVLR